MRQNWRIYQPLLTVVVVVNLLMACSVRRSVTVNSSYWQLCIITSRNYIIGVTFTLIIIPESLPHLRCLWWVKMSCNCWGITWSCNLFFVQLMSDIFFTLVCIFISFYRAWLRIFMSLILIDYVESWLWSNTRFWILWGHRIPLPWPWTDSNSVAAAESHKMYTALLKVEDGGLFVCSMAVWIPRRIPLILHSRLFTIVHTVRVIRLWFLSRPTYVHFRIHCCRRYGQDRRSCCCITNRSGEAWWGCGIWEDSVKASTEAAEASGRMVGTESTETV